MQAILSDVHGNWEALQAVLADAKVCGATEIISLGNLVGYGPDPILCVQRALSFDVVLLGHCDAAALGDDDLPGWSAEAPRQTILKVRRQLKEHPNGQLLEDFLRNRPTRFQIDKICYVNGTWAHHYNEYHLPEDIYNLRKMDRISQEIPHVCFAGKTGIPGVFNQISRSDWSFRDPHECESLYRLNETKTICNVGSVGRPRDKNPSASYVLFDGQSICFRRIEYDIETTVKKIYAGLDFQDYLGGMLREGR